MPEFLQNLLPPKVRQTIYSVLATAYTLELIFDVIPDGAQSKIVQALAVLGFTLATANVAPKEG